MTAHSKWQQFIRRTADLLGISSDYIRTRNNLEDFCGITITADTYEAMLKNDRGLYLEEPPFLEGSVRSLADRQVFKEWHKNHVDLMHVIPKALEEAKVSFSYITDIGYAPRTP